MAISSNATEEEMLALYRQAIRSAWRQKGDHNTWPIKLNAAIHLFVKEFGEEFLEDLNGLEQSGHTQVQIAQTFGTPSRLFRLIDHVIYSMRRSRYPIDAQRSVVVKLLTMVHSLKSGSAFNEDGCNIVLAPEAVRRASETLQAAPPASLEESQLVHRLCGVLWAYTEALYFRAHDLAKEIHGPYRHSELLQHDQIIVKEYFHLRPLHLWTSMPLLPDRPIRVLQQYTSEVSFQIDALNHLSQTGGRLPKNLQRFVVEIDGKPQPVSVLKEYIETAAQTIRAVARQLDTMTWHDRVERYAEIFWLRKKPLRDARGLETCVPTAVRQRIANGTELEARQTYLSPEASERLAMLTI